MTAQGLLGAVSLWMWMSVSLHSHLRAISVKSVENSLTYRTVSQFMIQKV